MVVSPVRHSEILWKCGAGCRSRTDDLLITNLNRGVEPTWAYSPKYTLNWGFIAQRLWSSFGVLHPLADQMRTKRWVRSPLRIEVAYHLLKHAVFV